LSDGPSIGHELTGYWHELCWVKLLGKRLRPWATTQNQRVRAVLQSRQAWQAHANVAYPVR